MVFHGDAATVLADLPDSSAQTVVTSPPYWGLRDYHTDGQIGLDPTVDQYVAGLVGVFEQVWRVLRPDGTLWLVVGDCYTSGSRRTYAPDRRNPHRQMSTRPATPHGLKPKDLIGVPWRLVFALQTNGWWVRQCVVWRKPNAQPESVADRPTTEHETLFLLARSQRYVYDAGAVLSPTGGRLRSVWEFPTRPHQAVGGHPAVFPQALAERCIRLTTRPGDVVLDPFLGSGTTAVAAQTLGRRYMGIDINQEYVNMSCRRLTRTAGGG